MSNYPDDLVSDVILKDNHPMIWDNISKAAAFAKEFPENYIHVESLSGGLSDENDVGEYTDDTIMYASATEYTDKNFCIRDLGFAVEKKSKLSKKELLNLALQYIPEDKLKKYYQSPVYYKCIETNGNETFYCDYQIKEEYQNQVSNNRDFIYRPHIYITIDNFSDEENIWIGIDDHISKYHDDITREDYGTKKENWNPNSDI